MAREQRLRSEHECELNHTNRRRFLAALGGTAATAALAGCSARGDDADGSDGAAPKPDAEQLDAGGWEQVATDTRRLFEQSFAGGRVTVTADGRTTEYEDTVLQKSISEKTLGQIDTALAVFSVTQITLDPNPADFPFGIGTKEVVGEIRSQAKETFRAQLRAAGLSNIDEAGESDLALDSGEEVTLTEFAAEYEYDGFRLPLSEEGGLTLDGGALDIAGLLGVWQDGRYVVVAGGAHPAARFDQSVRTELSEAIAVSVDIDLGLTPDEYDAELRDLIASIE